MNKKKFWVIQKKMVTKWTAEKKQKERTILKRSEKIKWWKIINWKSAEITQQKWHENEKCEKQIHTTTHTHTNPLRVLQYKITEGTGKLKHSEGTRFLVEGGRGDGGSTIQSGRQITVLNSSHQSDSLKHKNV